jgi:predicted nicotinamide N-methyase
MNYYILIKQTLINTTYYIIIYTNSPVENRQQQRDICTKERNPCLNSNKTDGQMTSSLFEEVPLPQGVFSINDEISIRTQPVKPIDATEQALFADEIWPGGIKASEFLRQYPHICRNKCILELGAGAALPSLVALALGAEKVVITDYPNERLLDNIKKMVIKNNFKLEQQAFVREHEWGTNVRECLDLSKDGLGFDLVLICESFWSATYKLHSQLLNSIYNFLSINGVAIVSFSHHITEDHPPERDLEFFQLAMVGGFLVEVYKDPNDNKSKSFQSEGYQQDKVHIFLLKKRPLNIQNQQQHAMHLRTYASLDFLKSYNASDYDDLV